MLIIEKIPLKPSKDIEVIDITPKIKEFITKNQISTGIVTVQSMHTTAGLLLNESEEGFLVDLETAAKRLAPRDIYYRHDDKTVRKNMQPDERLNGWSHIQTSMLAHPQLHFAVENGKLVLGTYQSILFVDFDGKRRKREVAVFAKDTILDGAKQ